MIVKVIDGDVEVISEEEILQDDINNHLAYEESVLDEIIRTDEFLQSLERVV